MPVAASAPLWAGSAKEPVAPKAKPFALTEVRLLDGPFGSAMERNREYLHALEPDGLLHTFRITAGLPSAAQPLG